tara:strand:- start:240 stop:545 length:306 start_codon:yes stop_codon:yes gene_type:complete
MKVNKICLRFNLTEDQYNEYNCSLIQSHSVVHSDSNQFSILYFDGDGGVVIFKNPSEISDTNGFSIELINCSYCDVSFKDMSEILKILNAFPSSKEYNNEA